MTQSSPSPSDSIPISRLIIIAITSIGTLLTGWVLFTVQTQTSDVAALKLAVRDLQTWRETQQKQVDSLNQLVGQLSALTQKQDVSMEHTALTLRELNEILKSLNLAQIQLKSSVTRIEIQLERPVARR